MIQRLHPPPYHIDEIHAQDLAIRLLSYLRWIDAGEFRKATDAYEYLSDWKNAVVVYEFGYRRMANGCPLCEFYDMTARCPMSDSRIASCCGGGCAKNFGYQDVADAFNNGVYGDFVRYTSIFMRKLMATIANDDKRRIYDE